MQVNDTPTFREKLIELDEAIKCQKQKQERKARRHDALVALRHDDSLPSACDQRRKHESYPAAASRRPRPLT